VNRVFRNIAQHLTAVADKCFERELRKEEECMPITTIWHPGMPQTDMTAGHGAMHKGYKLATQLLRETMQVQAPNELQAWDRIADNPEMQILCVDGDFDHIHHPLEALNIPHARISSGRLLGPALEEMKHVKAVLINCARRFPMEQALRAAEFVKQGGLLVTTDWALENVIQVAFPGTLSWNNRKTGNEFVEVQPYDYKTPAAMMLHNVALATGEPLRWWLEASSYPMEFPTEKLGQGIEILLYSNDLKERYGNGTVMARFSWGKGSVIHMISHAFLQQNQGQVALPGQGAGAGGGGPKTTQFFATSMGASVKTATSYAQAEQEDPNFNISAAASTTASTAVFLTTILPIVTDTIDGND